MNPSSRKNFRIEGSGRQKGFTLVEIIVVVVVIAIIGGTVMVSTESVNENTRLTNAGYRALSDVRYAQELAMTHNRTVNFIASTGSNGYDVKWADTGHHVQTLLDQENLIVRFGSSEYRGVTLTTALSSTLSFDSKGEPWIGGSRMTTDSQLVMRLNSSIYVTIYRTGYSDLQKPGGSGCGC